MLILGIAGIFISEEALFYSHCKKMYNGFTDTVCRNGRMYIYCMPFLLNLYFTSMSVLALSYNTPPAVNSQDALPIT